MPHPDHAPDDRANVFYNTVWSIHEDRAGTLWVGGDEGLFTFDRQTEIFTSFLPDPRNRVFVLLEDRTGTLWVGTDNGLFTFDREGERFTRFPHQPSGSANPTIVSIYEDRFGMLWIGSAGGGLMKLKRYVNPFTVYRHDPDDPNSLASNEIFGIYEDRRSILWIGTGRWLNRVDRKAGAVSRYRHDPRANSIYEDRAGTLWVGADFGSLDRMDRETGRFTRFAHDPDDPRSISLGATNHILEDQAGTLWIALYNGGIDRMDRERKTFTHYTSDSHGLGEDQVFRHYEAPSEPGILWVGTEQGLSRFDTQVEHFTNYHTEPLRRTTMMHEDRQGRFWVATASNGLHLFDRRRGTIEQTYTTEDGLANNIVWSIYEDNQGDLWLSTSNGLSKFDPETETFRNYYARDGLPSNSFREHAKHQSASGELFFGGPNGAVSFFPEEVVDNPVPPEVVLTDLRIAGEPVEIGPGSPLEASMMVTEAVTLSHGQNDLTIEYVGLHFLDPSQNRYRMEDYDAGWVEAGTQQTARYTNLDPGVYVFRVSARNGESTWNEKGASVRITIHPPWWRTMWAYGLYLALFGTLAFAVDRVQRRRLIRKERAKAELREKNLRAHAAENLANYLQSENLRQTQELDAARALQLSMLPETMPEHPAVELAAFMETATEVGGDYYDFDLSDDGTLTLAIGDATGHGTKAGTMVTATKSLWNAFSGEADLVRVLEKTSEALKRMGLPKLYMALALVRLHGHTLELAGAGMPPALVYRAATRQVETIPKGMPLGGPGTFPYQKTCVLLSAGDTVLLMSDGFPELFNDEGEMLGYERAVEVFEAVASRSPEEIIAHMRETGEAWSNGRAQDDDVTFVVMKVKANTGGKGERTA